MADFPTLSSSPDADKWQEEGAIDPTIRSTFENGKRLTRARFTKVPQKWTLIYRLLSNTDKQTLQTFEQDTVNYGSASFNWTNPIDGVSYEVRFAEPVKYKYANNLAHQWDVDIVLEEV